MVVVCLLVIACVPDRYVAPRARLNGGTSAGTRSGAQAHQPDGVPPSTLLESGVSADLGNDDRVHVAQVYRWSAEETADLLGPWMAGRMHRRHHRRELVGLGGGQDGAATNPTS